jgi:glyoxylase-like metal-dependent hydrolase (beta-lactamase superfamily II)
MTRIHHLNCVNIESPFGASAIGHCLLLEDDNGLALVDCGIGLLDTMDPLKRISQELIDAVGFRFDEQQTAIRQIEKMGLDPGNVRFCIATHLDPDHIGALADFPSLELHVSEEEYQNFLGGNKRYLAHQLSHTRVVRTYTPTDKKWFGLEARKVDLLFDSEIFLVPLFGHTLGHCGVAIKTDTGWTFHIGDAYYLRVETETDNHPISNLATMRADDNELRIKSLTQIKQLLEEHPEIEIFSYHDPLEFPG